MMSQIQDLLKALNSPHWWDRNEAMKRLMEYPEQEYMSFLEDALRNHDDDTLRNAAMEFYRLLGHRATDSLVKLLKDSDEEVRLFAATLLGETVNTQSVNALIEALNDPAPNVRAAAAEALGRIKSAEAIEALQRVMNDEPWVAMAAIKSLGDIGTPQAVNVLCAALDRYPQYRAMIIEAIEATSDRDAISVLMRYLKDSEVGPLAIKAVVNISLSQGIRPAEADLKEFVSQLIQWQALAQPELSRAAAVALCWSSDDRGIPYFVEALQDESLQEYAIEAILRKGQKAVSFLLQALRSSGHSNRALIARVLSQIGACRELKEFMNDPDPEVRTEVALAAGNMPVEEAEDVLQRLMNDPDEEVQMAALRSLRLQKDRRS